MQIVLELGTFLSCEGQVVGNPRRYQTDPVRIDLATYPSHAKNKEQSQEQSISTKKYGIYDATCAVYCGIPESQSINYRAKRRCDPSVDSHHKTADSTEDISPLVIDIYTSANHYSLRCGVWTNLIYGEEIHPPRLQYLRYPSRLCFPSLYNRAGDDVQNL